MASNEIIAISNEGNRFDVRGKWLRKGSYSAGSYRVGIDIPGGIYNVYDRNGEGAYGGIQDLSGKVYYNDFFYVNYYVDLKYADVLILSMEHVYTYKHINKVNEG